MLARTTLRRTANRMRFAAPLAVVILLITAAMAQAAAPGKPNGFGLTDSRTLGSSGTNTISLDWNDVGGRTCYLVYRGTSPLTPPTAVSTAKSCDPAVSGAIAAPTASNHPDTVPNGLTKYFYYVVAVNTTSGGGTSEGSAQITTNTPPNAVTDTLTVVEDESTAKYASFFLDNDAAFTGASSFGETTQTMTLDRASGGGVTGLTNPSHGTLIYVNYGQYWRYTPSDDFSGEDTFEFRVCDSGMSGARKLCSVGTVTVNVTEVNDPVSAANDDATTAEDTPKDIDVTANDSKGAGESDQTLTITSITQQGSKGTATIVGNKVRYSPNPDVVANNDVVRYQVCDNGTTNGLPDTSCDTAKLTVDITAVNDAPIANADLAYTGEDTAVVIDVLHNDATGPANESTQAFSSVNVTGLSHGTASVNSDMSITFTPSANYNGNEATVAYQVCDNGTPSRCASATATITVTAANDAPVATADTVQTNEDTPATFDVLVNDHSGGSDESNGLVPVITTGPSHGTAIVVDGAVLYTPVGDYNGPDGFVYEALETVGGALRSAPVSVSITVAAVNDAPVATDDAESTTEDNLAVIDVLANDINGGGTDESTQSLSARIVTNGSKGTAVADRADGKLTYTPNTHANGTDTFTYEAYDDAGGDDTSNVVTVTVTITPVNDAPDAQGDTFSTDEDTTGTFDVLDNDTPGGGSDEDDQKLLTTIVTNGAKGTATADAQDGTVSYAPKLNATGTDTFTYEAFDDGSPVGTSEIVTVTVTIAPVDDAPVAVADAMSTNEDTTGTFDVLANDTAGGEDDDDEDSRSKVVTNGSKGTASANADGTIDYTPNANVNGTDSFTYLAFDSGDPSLESAPVTVTVTIVPTNDVPTVTDDPTGTVVEDGSVELAVLANDSSGAADESNGLMPTDISTPAHGTATALHGKILYTPAPDYVGTDSFTYRAIETIGGSLKSVASATVSVTVTEINDAPTATTHAVSTTEDAPSITLTVLTGATRGGGTDEAGQSMIAVLNSGPSHGTLTLNVDGSASYSPSSNYFGTDTFVYKVCDNGTTGGAAAPLCSTPRTVTITVAPVNDAPTAPQQNVTLNEDATLKLNLLTGANRGPENEKLDKLTATITAGPSNGTLVEGTYRPTTNFHGSDAVETRICDAGLPVNECVDSRINITVLPVNDAPVAVDDVATIAEDADALSVKVAANDTDVEGDERTVSAPTLDAAAAGSVAVVDNEVVYTAAANFNGTATITYTITDDGVSGAGPTLDAKSDQGTLTVTVTEVNDAVDAVGDTATTNEDTPVTLDTLTSNDAAGPANESSQSLSISGTGTTEHGQVEVVDGDVVFTPNADFFGETSFTYTVHDNGTTNGTIDGTSGTALVTVTVVPVNDAPIADADAATTAEDTAVTVTDLLDGDVAGPVNERNIQTLSIASAQDATHGSVALVDGGVKFTPEADYHGAATFTYTVRDSGTPSLTDTETVTVTITAVNDRPVADGETASTDENTPVEIDVLTGDSAGPADEDQGLEIAGLSTPQHGTVAVVDGKVTYTPATDYNGTDSFTYTAHETGEGSLSSEPATVNVTVRPSNTAPLANDGAFSATEGETTTIDLSALARDIETSDARLTYVIDQQPTNGTLSGSGAVRTYTSNPTFGGVDTIKFHVIDAGDPTECGVVTPGVCENKLSSNVATVTLNVTAKPVVVVTPPPVVVDTPGQADTTDRTKPTVTFQSVKLPAGKARVNGVTVKVKTNKRAKTVVTIYLNVREAKFLGFKTTKPLIIGTGTVEGDGGIQSVKIKLTFKGKQAIARRSQPSLHLAVRVASSNAYGTGNARGTITIIKPKR